MSRSVCVLLFAGAVFAQSDRGTITGTVSDPAGAVIANATVEARNSETGTAFPAQSTSTGNYTIPELPVGTYEVDVTVPGFKKFQRTGITVATAAILRIDVTLEVGASTESVTVQADASLLKTESADVTQNVTVQTLDQLPMLGVGSAAAGSAGIRNPNNVVDLVPGTYYVPNSQVKINGAPSNTQAFHVEGQDATNQGFPYAAAQTQPSVDAIQEVAVQTSNFAPEFGAAAGGFFNVTMKSGTNQFHGTAYDYFVNEVLNAGTPFTDAGTTNSQKEGQLVRPPARRNDYGFTVGGPVWIPKLYNGHDKTFFFFNFEQFRETQQINNIPITVPIDAYRQGNFSQAITALGNKVLGTDILGRTEYANEIFDPATARTINGVLVADPFPNNTIPANRLDPVALKVQNVIPEPNIGGVLINNYLPTYPAVRHTTIPALKIDHSLTAASKLSFYWSTTQTEAPFSPTYGGSEGFPNQITADRGSFIHSKIFRLNYDQTLTPTVLLHVGAGYQQNNFFDDAPVLNFNAAQTYGLVGATLNRNAPVFTGFCSAVLPCSAAGGTYNMGPGAGQSHDFWEKPSFNASTTWVKENHTFKFGSEIYLNSIPAIPYTNTNGSYTFSANETAQPYQVGTTFAGGSLGFPYASFLLGAVDSYSIAAPAEFHFGKTQFAAFIQDSWKVTRKLTLDYGVRYDYGTYYNETYGRAMGFSPTTPNPSAGNEPGGWIFEGSGPGRCNCRFASNYPYALGPRVGGAYQITPKTVLRGGWGLIYNQTSTNQLGVNTPGIVTSVTVGSPGQGVPAMTLANGIPQSSIPSWPNFSPGVAPRLPVGNQPTPTLGVGGFSNAGWIDPELGRPARQNQWSVGIQRELRSDLVVEASYVANRGVWWQAPGLVNMNGITPQILAAYGLNLSSPADQQLLLSTLSSATAAARGFNNPPYAGFATSNTVAQALRPFPQFGYIPAIGPPLGKTWYDSLQAKATKRFSHGLTFTGTFAWQKSLQEGEDTNSNTTIGGTTNVVLNNIANPAGTKAISLYDQPFVFTFVGSYSVPTLHTNRAVSWVLKDWQLGTLLQYASGLPIPTPAATTSLAGQIFQPTLADRVQGVPLYTVDINCHCYDPSKTFVLNPAAWVNPPAGQFGTSAEFYSDFRYERHPVENMNFGRTFRLRERMTLNLRVEFNNVFNRTYLNNPSATTPFSPQATLGGLTTGGFGYINRATTGTQFGQPRNGTIVARFSF
ncbi:MAG: TonB-dependent receptor [Acidobacteriia bacterium]|nr:TonB-dependent receptor [Terriglobia bacterium]